MSQKTIICTAAEFNSAIEEKKYPPLYWKKDVEIIIRTNVDNKTFVQGHRRKILSENDVLEMKSLKNNGALNKDLAMKYCCSERTIRRYLKD